LTRRRDDGFFGTGIPNSAPRGKSKGRRNVGADNIFDLGLTQGRPAGRKKKFRNEFGTDFNIFAV